MGSKSGCFSEVLHGLNFFDTDHEIGNTAGKNCIDYIIRMPFESELPYQSPRKNSERISTRASSAGRFNFSARSSRLFPDQIRGKDLIVLV